MKLLMYTIFLAALLPSISVGEEKAAHTEPKQSPAEGVEALPSDVRQLLSQEMEALQSGMMAIIPAYVSGNWAEIEMIAGKIKNSYLLKKNLTKEQVHALHSILPHTFIEKDKQFHYLAGMLEHAAKNKKPELINFYFSKMNESCVDCHTHFATHKFPALMHKTTEKHSHAH
ncbi:MAG: cytochrome c [Methylococcales bacterium]|nr:cytochrome c [Methylococcales bacterium]